MSKSDWDYIEYYTPDVPHRQKAAEPLHPQDWCIKDYDRAADIRSRRIKLAANLVISASTIGLCYAVKNESLSLELLVALVSAIVCAFLLSQFW